MKALKGIEDKLGDFFKGLPQLPDSSKEGLVNIWPWLALVAGILQLWAAWALYDLSKFASRLGDIADSLSIYYTGNSVGPSSMDKTIIYLGIVILVVDAVILLMAFPKLKVRAKSGWDLLFLASVLNLAYAVVQIFTYNRGVGSFIGSLIGSAIGFYLLFQVREKFGGRNTTASSTPHS